MSCKVLVQPFEWPPVPLIQIVPLLFTRTRHANHQDMVECWQHPKANFYSTHKTNKHLNEQKRTLLTCASIPILFRFRINFLHFIYCLTKLIYERFKYFRINNIGCHVCFNNFYSLNSVSRNQTSTMLASH